MTDIDALPCTQCGKPLGEHTMAEYRQHTAVDLPFEPVKDPTYQAPDDEQILVDHLDVAATVVKADTVSGTVILPAIEFRFRTTTGSTIVAPILFLADDERTFKRLRQLVSGACDLAPMRAKALKKQRRAEEGQ